MIVARCKKALVKLIDLSIRLLAFNLRDRLIEKLFLLRYRMAGEPTIEEDDRYARRRDRYTRRRT